MNRPINQVFLGGDPYHTLDDIDIQIQNMENYRNKLQQLKALQTQQTPVKLIWDDIDAEVRPMSDEQKKRMFDDAEYVETYTKLNEMVQIEILNLVKAKIENTTEGKELLSQQLKIVKRLKSEIINETNREMEMFKRFKEFSKLNPGVTYEEFIKASM
jgi:hypothetical protein